MIEFKKYALDNGLTVILHKDASTPIVAVNTLYKVGARNEQEHKTGFAHLFEHLMFGGSKNIENYDGVLQNAGGENNAFTNNDITNYYITLPKENLETALWLESDRMLELAFTPKSLEVQRKVVIEEFKQRYLNQPYGDLWLKLRPLAYTKHPYKWPTIGKEIAHIEQATMQDVKEFFYRFYRPNNAILCIAGDIDFDQTIEWVEKWYGSIAGSTNEPENIEKEPSQQAVRTMHCQADVPNSVLYKVFHMCGRKDGAYHTTDLLSDVLSAGNSSRFSKHLRTQQDLLGLEAYVMGSLDPGLFVFSAKLNENTSFELAEKVIDEHIEQIVKEQISDQEHQKIINRCISAQSFSQVELLNKAMNLCYYEFLSDASLINTELDRYKAVSKQDIQEVAQSIFRASNASVMYYKAQ